MAKYKSLLEEKRTLEVTDTTEIKIDVNEKAKGNGRPHIDIRTFIHTDNYDGATKKGVNFDLEWFREFKDKLDDIEEELIEKGLL